MNAIAQASPTPASGPKLDNRRVMAAIVDLVVVSAGALVILVAGNSLSGDRPGALAAVIIGWALYYFFALESGEGQTLGKKLMKIRVVRADGRPAGMGEIAVRTILRVIDNYLVGLIVMLATGERRQRIGDLAAGTIVVDASGPAVAAPPAPVLDEAGPVEDEPDSYEPVDDELDSYEPGDEAELAELEEPAAGETITLPARPAPPATLADLTEPEAEDTEDEPVVAEVAEEPVTEDELVAEEAVEEPVVAEVVEEPVAEEPVAEEPAAEEPVAEEPVAEEEPAVTTGIVPLAPAVEPEDELPRAMSPALEELAEDVAAAHLEAEGEDHEAAAVEPEAEDAVDGDPAADDEPVNVKSVETVSAMDLIMGAAEEAADEDASEPEEPASA